MTLADTHAASTVPGHVLDVVVSALAAHSGAAAQTIDTTKPLSAIPGIESVKALRAITEIEDELGISIPDDFLFETATVGELAGFVASLAEESAG